MPPAPDDRDADPGATYDESGLLGGKLRVLQPMAGYRAGLDAGLLAAAVGARPGERVLEAGCGVGAALLQAAARAPQARFVGVERDPASIALARRNVCANAMEARVEVESGDVADGFGALNRHPFDSAFANPPFFDNPGALRGPAPERRGAWLADAGLAAWVRFLVTAVRGGGRVTLIHRADRLGDVLAALAAKPAAGSVQIRPIHPFGDRPAKRVIVRAIRAGRAPLVLLPAIVLQGPASEAQAILRGEAALGWSASVQSA